MDWYCVSMESEAENQMSPYKIPVGVKQVPQLFFCHLTEPTLQKLSVFFLEAC